jgi:hypothetical protein
MSQIVSDTRTRPVSPLVHSIRWGLGALAVAIGSAIYGAYGDPHPKANQEHAVPGICAVLVVVAVLGFGLLVPAGLRALAARRGSWSGGALALGIVALLSVPVSFWSGLPVLLGTAAVLLGAAGRRAAIGKLTTAAFVLGWIAVAGGLLLTVLGNTVASS